MPARLRPPLETRHQRHVLLDRQMRKEPDVLQHISGAAPEPYRIPVSRVAPVDQDRSMLRQQQPIRQLQQRALARTASPDERQNFPPTDGQADPIEHNAALVGICHLAQFDDGAGVPRWGRWLNRLGRSHGALCIGPIPLPSRSTVDTICGWPADAWPPNSRALDRSPRRVQKARFSMHAGTLIAVEPALPKTRFLSRTDFRHHQQPDTLRLDRYTAPIEGPHVLVSMPPLRSARLRSR